MVRVWIFVIWLPSVRMVQMRSTLCQGPSWQNISSVGIGGRELQVIQPVVGAMDHLDFAGCEC